MKKLDYKKARRWLRVSQAVFVILILLFIVLAAIYGGDPSSAEGGSGVGGTGLPAVVDGILFLTSALVGVLGVVMTIIGGLVYATSQGNPNQANLGRDMIISAISGLALYGFSHWLIYTGVSKFFPPS